MDILKAGKPGLSDRFIFIAELNLHVAKERTLHGRNWLETHKALVSNGERMLTIMEFIEFLRYIRVALPDLYGQINEKRMGSPWTAEWLDADFKKIGDDIYMNSYHVIDTNGDLVPQKSEAIDNDTLMNDRTPFPSNSGMSLEDYLESGHTGQGLPNKEVKPGEEYYFYPTGEFKTGTIFDRAGLNCGRGLTPFDGHPSLGVRAVIGPIPIIPLPR